MAMPRVLVVDDHPDTLRLFQTFLSLAGFDVVAFTRASDALSAAADVDAVATDLAMPGMDGFELIRRLRASPHVPAIPIVAVTGQSLDLEKVVPADIGCCRVVLKPCDLGQLADALRSLIDTCPRACAHCANR